MERFAFVVVMTVAILWAIWHFWGGPNLVFAEGVHWGGHWGHEDPVQPVSRGHTAPQTFASRSIRIEAAAARVIVTPEDRADISVEIDNPGHLPMPTVQLDGGSVVVDGHVRNRIEDCMTDGARVRGYGAFAAADLPQIIVHAPRELSVSATSGDITQIGPSRNLDAAFAGCGNAQIADVAGPLKVSVAGSGNVSTGAAQSLDARVAGSGELNIGRVTGKSDVRVAGSGDVTIAAVEGDFTSRIAGSGDVTVQGGSVGSADVETAGSGDTAINAPVHHLQAHVMGSGDVTVRGAVVDVDAQVAGSGDVTVASATGSVNQSVAGSGRVRIGQ